MFIPSKPTKNLPKQSDSTVVIHNALVIYIINSPYNLSLQNCPQYSDRVQFRFLSPELCIIEHLKNTKLYPIEFSRTEMTSDPSNYHRDYSPHGSNSLFLFDSGWSDVISVLKKSIEFSFVFFKYLFDNKPVSKTSQTGP